MKKEGRHASHYQQYYWKKGEAEYGKWKETSKKMVLHSNCMYVNQYDWCIHDSGIETSKINDRIIFRKVFNFRIAVDFDTGSS